LELNKKLTNIYCRHASKYNIEKVLIAFLESGGNEFEDGPTYNGLAL
jgi:hypothetical protein